jgi:hypothetical protein
MYFSKEEKIMWLEDWQKSGKQAWSYAKENGLCPQTFTRWTKVKPQNNCCFVEVSTKLKKPPEYAQQILIEKADLKIHVPLLPGSEQLRLIFNALGWAV